jgi:hypothetical protein
VNFIKHFLGFMDHVSTDERLTPHHVSLYITLFQFWNLNHFRNPISISREEVMHISKIGSVNTYVKCLKDLHAWGYIRYEPSYNPQRGSKVHMYRFDNGTNKTVDNAESRAEDKTAVQPVSPSINKLNNTNIVNREKEIPRTQESVVDFFLSKNSTEPEAHKFFNHFLSNGWRVGGRTPMKDWQAAATKWILNTNNFTNARDTKPAKLNTSPTKDYSEPL